MVRVRVRVSDNRTNRQEEAEREAAAAAAAQEPEPEPLEEAGAGKEEWDPASVEGNGLFDLPREVMLTVFARLAARDLASLSQTCKTLAEPAQVRRPPARPTRNKVPKRAIASFFPQVALYYTFALANLLYRGQCEEKVLF